MRLTFIAALLLLLGGCVTSAPEPRALPPDASPEAVAARASVERFIKVVAAVEPVAEDLCRREGVARNCAFRILVDDRPDQPANAFQTLDRRGRPVIVFTLALIADARNPDELAFVMGHEAAHHIAGHIPRRQDQALAGAMAAGILAQANGLSPDDVRAAQTLGAEVAARSYSRDFELEADSIGARITLLAGFDPVLGTGFFDRLPDPGDRFLGSHPPNAERKAVVAATVRQLQAS
jgi:predicted Zn-dependent protease